MTARLPTPGPRDVWGDDFLDWLRVHGNEDGSLKSDAVRTALGGSMSVLTSPTYGQASIFGNGGGFTFAGTGTPTDIYAPAVFYEKYGTNDGNNTPVTKTTQAFFSSAAYYGPTADDSAECGSCYVGIKNTGVAFTQSKIVTGFEAQASAEGANHVTGSFRALAGRPKFKDTSTVDEGISVYATFEKDAGATVTTYYAFKQVSSGPGATNWGFYVYDRGASEQGLRVGRSGNNGIFDVDWSFGHGNAFIYAQLPDGTDKTVMRLQAISGQTQHLQGWFDSSSVERIFVTAAGGLVVNGQQVTAQVTGVNKMQLGGFLKWMDAALTQTTVGSAGAASALPATPTKYLQVQDASGTTLVIPAYAAS